MFRITQGKGFAITFENGLTISVQCGAGNYCENKNKNMIEEFKRSCGESIIESNDAEIAIFDKDNNFITEQFTDEGDGQVVGWLTVSDVFEIIDKVRNHKV